MISGIKHPLSPAWDVLNVPVSQAVLYRKGRTRSCTPRWGVTDPNVVALSYLCGIYHETWRRSTRSTVVGAAQGSSDGFPAPTISEAEPAGRRGSTNGAKSPKKIDGTPASRKSRVTGKAGSHASARPSKDAISTVVRGGTSSSPTPKNVAEELVSVSRSGPQSSRTKTVKPVLADVDGDAAAVEVVLAEGSRDDAETNPAKIANPQRSRLQKDVPDERDASSSESPEASEEDEDVPEEHPDNGAGPSDSKRVKGATASAQAMTVRMVRLPGGRLVDPRTVKGWVILPDGRKVVCGRCGGRSVLKLANLVGSPSCGCSLSHAQGNSLAVHGDFCGNIYVNL